MGNPTFGSLLKNARTVRGISLNGLGKEMLKFGAGKGAAANLSRLEGGGDESPTEKRVRQIANALSSMADDSGSEKFRLFHELMSAAGFAGITDEGQIAYLRRKAKKRLQSTPDLKPHEIDTILDHVSVPMMKQIADTPKSEEIRIVDLRDIASELAVKARMESRVSVPPENFDPDTLGDLIFSAGRANIYLHGDTTPEQHRLILDVATLLRNALGDFPAPQV